MAKYPVVVYGASGYTGMLIMDWLIDQQIPFTAVARDAQRAHEMMAQRVVRCSTLWICLTICESSSIMCCASVEARPSRCVPRSTSHMIRQMQHCRNWLNWRT